LVIQGCFESYITIIFIPIAYSSVNCTISIELMNKLGSE